MVSSSTISRLDLEDPAQGWKNVTVQGCERYLSRYSFGYWCGNSSFYVFGGFVDTQASNSALNFTPSDELGIGCTVMYEEEIMPSRRQGASMVYASGGFYLFGGENQGILLNDLWFYNITSAVWNNIIALGASPAPRRRHAADVQGNYMVIVGGITYDEVLLSDYYLYDTIAQVWTQLLPRPGTAIPQAVANTCVMLDLPRFYYVGGQTGAGLTLSIWRFDLSNLEFAEIYRFRTSSDVPLFKHKCTLYLDEEHNEYIYTYFGSKTLMDVPYCGIMMFNLSAEIVRPEVVLESTEYMPCRTDSAFANLNNEFIVFAGGQRFNKDVFSDVWVLSFIDFSETQLDDLSSPLYASASSFINNTLYIFSGFSNNGLSINSPSSDSLETIQLSNFTASISSKFNLTCGVGMKFNGKTCEFCEAGTYNNEIFNEICAECPLGSINLYLGASDISQCVPCAFGSYSTDPSTPCLPCAASDICYIGTSNTSLTAKTQEFIEAYATSESQPPMYSPPEGSRPKEILYILTGALVFCFLLAYYLSYNFRVVLSYYDVFKNFHFEILSTAEGEHIPKDFHNRPSKFGGFCSVITVITLGSITCHSIIVYVYTNATEDIIMVPVGALIEEHRFGSQEFSIEMMLASYRGDCSDRYLSIGHASDILFKTKAITADGPLCVFSGTFTSVNLINSGDFIQFNLTEILSYTSDIIIRLSVDSSVPGYQSMVTQRITALPGDVFRGSIPTIFYFNILPSYYKETDMLSSSFSRKGYHISQTTAVLPGSLTRIESIPLVSGLSIMVNMVRSDIGITTYKYPQVDFFSFFFKLLSDLPGTIVFVGFAMWFIEYIRHLLSGKDSGRSRLVRRQMELERIERREKKNKIILGRNRDPSFDISMREMK